jgi:hypothetical protein
MPVLSVRVKKKCLQECKTRCDQGSKWLKSQAIYTLHKRDVYGATSQ